MPAKHKVLALCGSTRKNSTNLNLIKAIADLTKEKFEIIVFEGLTEIPHFNPDLDTDNPPQLVTDFRKKLREVNGILICTPEYAMGVPGTLKNVIDWTVSSMEFSKKPTALITASSMGEKGHASLLETLKVIEADITDETQLLIPFAKTKVSQDCKITDSKTLSEVNALLNAFFVKL
ncbi:MAG: NADPH-dependent FMN reductase [Cyclobacteriaceae bacterium]